jgi:glycosyltransferase involved in cell wall biosynthesis
LISVVIATHDSEALLVPTLAALVPGALAGIVREVIVADAGSSDDTAKVADIAGCTFMVAPGSLGARLAAAAATTRANWLLFLQPGTVLGARWMDEVSRFMHEAQFDGSESRAAVFRQRARRRQSALSEAFALIASSFGTLPRPDQGLLIAKRHYDAIGGHHADQPDPEINLLRRLGRRRIETLRSGAGIQGD